MQSGLMYRNSEGYSDPTAGQAMQNVQTEEKKARGLLRMIRTAAELMAEGAGYELKGQVCLKDSRTGRMYR